MKKLLCLLSAVLLGFTSCSKDDNNDSSEPASLILVKKIIYGESDGISYFSNYVYDGNKIISITDEDGFVMKNTYTGDFVTKIESITESGNLDATTEYSYVNGKLSFSDRKITNQDKYNRTKFVYNTDGTVSYQEYTIDSKTEIETIKGKVVKLTFKDGNLVKRERSNNDGSQTLDVYEYDTKNSPFKNALGFTLLDEEASVNNLVKKTQTFTSEDGINTIYITTYDYKYDSNNYPTEVRITYQNPNSPESVETFKYTY